MRPESPFDVARFKSASQKHHPGQQGMLLLATRLLSAPHQFPSHAM